MKSMSNKDFNERMRERTKLFALQIINITNDLPNKESAKVISKQLLQSSTSVAANFRAACRGRSKAEFYSKICIVVEEADESQFWLEMLCDSRLINKDKIGNILNECSEIIAITTSIKNKLKS